MRDFKGWELKGIGKTGCVRIECILKFPVYTFKSFVESVCFSQYWAERVYVHEHKMKNLGIKGRVELKFKFFPRRIVLLEGIL